MGAPAYERFGRMRASLAYRCYITAIEVLLIVVVVRGLVWLLGAVQAPRVLYVPLGVASAVIGVVALVVAVVSGAVLFATGRRWGGGGVSVSGQMEFTLMVLEDLRHPLSWPSRRYERW